MSDSSLATLVPSGGVLAGTRYGQPSRASVGEVVDARPFIGGASEYIEPPDPRHCQWIEDDHQCGSWPVKKPEVENPDHYCAGHLRKVAATNGPNASADQGLHSSAS